MRNCFRLLLLIASPLLATATDFTVHVSDATGSAVAGASVRIYRLSNNANVGSANTSAAGTAVFPILQPGPWRVQVLAPGFAEKIVETGEQSNADLNVQLKVAVRNETVVVTATETPLPADETGAPVETVDRGTLLNRQPVDAADAIRYLAGAVINTDGRRGGLASLFVRGGDSDYNKVIVDGVPVNEPGGIFDFGVVPTIGGDRFEFVRGPESVLYGSDALTSVVQLFSATGTTRTPELTLSSYGGTFSTADGSASVAGAVGRIDYNLFAEQFNSLGQGINDAYSNSSEGANIGMKLASRVALRFRTRHTTERSGVQSFFNFNGQELIPPDSDQRARQNNFLASGDLLVQTGSQRNHSFSGYEYHHVRENLDNFMDPGRESPAFGNFDFPFDSYADLNRAGFMYHGEYDPRLWARTNFGYEFEDENGFIGDLTALPLTHGLRRNHALYAEQVLSFSRLTLVAGGRFVHNESFGNTGVPRAALTFLAHRGSAKVGATRLRVAYGQGIKEPSLDESFGTASFFIIPNPKLRPERNQTIETGFVQNFLKDRYSLSGTYYHNLFRDQITSTFDPTTFISQFINLNRSLAHGAEIEFHGRPANRVSLDAAYTYTSSQILQSPLATDPLVAAGQPLLRRPKHAGSATVNYLSTRWGANLSAVGIGRRTDSDFLGLTPHVDHAAGYVRADVSGWYELQRHVTAFVSVENLLNKRYEEAAGFPALKANFRASLRFRFGGE
ncbi:MAG: TonB-dependent receptor [Acidobacteria bacterium]|nr:TonB-dependent receptor [Acidobacteriota bacterium]